jgi:3-isopropylmalate/(R)-2-methylmalate dehydratase small subunit
MKPVSVITGRMLPLDRADVDTDQIMPKQYLKRIERTGFGEFLFADWRADPAFVLNDERYAGANVLVTGANFGCGSSREHAPWGLQQYGFDVIVAPSFADIFRINCAANGMLLIELAAGRVRALSDLATREPAAQVRVDLPEQTIETALGVERFDVDPHTKLMLTGGLDPIGLTLEREQAIDAFEAARPRWLPVT